jgi:uncharacterized membrane protein YheB (UPF0754 family)
MLYTLPFISAAIGYLTNYLAVKMLFRPKKQISIAGIKFQGIFPKRQGELAQKLGQLVSEELLSGSEIAAMLADTSLLSGAENLLHQKVGSFLDSFLAAKPMLAMFVSGEAKAQIQQQMVMGIYTALPELMADIAGKIESKIDVSKIVTDKVRAFSADDFERMLYSIMSREFRFIEILGAALGFVIGLAQMALVYFFYQ